MPNEAIFSSLALFALGGFVVWLLIRVEKQIGEQI
jgi:hypothetical protein